MRLNREPIRFAWYAIACSAAIVSGCRAAPHARTARVSNTEIAPAADRNAARVADASLAGQSPGAPSDPDDTTEIQPVSSEAPAVSDVPLPAVGPRELSLEEALEIGLSQNPELIAQRQAEGVGAAAVGVAETYPF